MKSAGTLVAAVLVLATVGSGPADRPPAGALNLEARVTVLEKAVADLAGRVAALERRGETGAVGPLPDEPIQVTTVDEYRASVKEVLGDATLRLADGGVVRLIGVDASRSPSRAATRARALLEGKTAWLEFDRARRDEAGRTWAYVYIGGQFVKADLIENGCARAAAAAPNLRHAALFQVLEREARAAKRGLWGEQAE